MREIYAQHMSVSERLACKLNSFGNDSLMNSITCEVFFNFSFRFKVYRRNKILVNFLEQTSVFNNKNTNDNNQQMNGQVNENELK